MPAPSTGSPSDHLEHRDALTGRPSRRRALGGALAAVIAAGLLASVAVIAVAPRPRLPEPTGPYGVGTTTRTWSDSSRPEPFTSDPDDHRSVIAQIWYPARPAPDAPTAPYMDRGTAVGLADVLGVPAALLTRVPGATTHAHPDASAADGRFPVLIHLSGFQSFRGEAQAWFEDLASHGYVVISLDQPGTAARTILPSGDAVTAISRDELGPLMPESVTEDDPAPVVNGEELPGGIVPFLARDARFALDRAEALDAGDGPLAGHLATDRAGVFGLSLGGYTAPEACRQDTRFRACLEADASQTAPVATDGIEQPLMVMTREASSMRRERDRAGGWPEAEIRQTVTAQRGLFANSTGPAWYLTINDFHHLNWSDLPLWSPLFRWRGLAGPIDPERGAALVATWSRAFLDRTLKDEAAPLLDGPSDAWPEVGVETR